MLNEIKKTNLSEVDTNFDWDILPVLTSPFLTNIIYNLFAEQIIEKYEGAIILGYGAGNVNIIGSDKTKKTKDYSVSYAEKFSAEELEKQKEFSIISFFEKIEKYNKVNKNDYKFIVMSSQVPIDNYDIDYEAGRVPLYYGALPSGDLSYPEAQTKLAFILGHKELIKEEAKKCKLTYEQVVKSCFLAGIKFNKRDNLSKFLEISEKECGCKVYVHPKNVFVKNDFKKALQIILTNLMRE